MSSRILSRSSRIVGLGVGRFGRRGNSGIIYDLTKKRMGTSSSPSFRRRPLPRTPDVALTTIRLEEYHKEFQRQQRNHANNFVSSPTPSLSIPSPYDDISTLMPPWLMAKIPKGFENFFPKQKEGDADGSETITESSSSKAGEETRKGTASGDSQTKQTTFKTKSDDHQKDDIKKNDRNDNRVCHHPTTTTPKTYLR